MLPSPVAILAQSALAPASAPAQAIKDGRALQVLKGMSETLARAKTLGFSVRGIVPVQVRRFDHTSQSWLWSGHARPPPGPRRRGRGDKMVWPTSTLRGHMTSRGYSNAKTRFQSFFMLITVHPFFLASSKSDCVNVPTWLSGRPLAGP